jgi:hypothetical protein
MKGAASAALGMAPAWVFLSEPAYAPLQSAWGDNFLAVVWQNRRWARVRGRATSSILIVEPRSGI